MEDLPQLDIQEDIATLMESEDDEPCDEAPLQDLSRPIQPKNPSEIFVNKPKNVQPEEEEESEPEPAPELNKKGKPKRKLSKKQKEHLDKVRLKAVEACKQKKRDRLEVEARVKAELKEKKEKKRLEKQKAKRPTTPPPIEKPTPTAPPPLPYAPVDPDQEFGNFMANMERFEKMRHEYHQARKPKPVKATSNFWLLRTTSAWK